MKPAPSLLWLLAGLLALAIQPVMAQKNRSVPFDAQSAELVHTGKQYVLEKDYQAALKIFETVARRSYNQSTTAAVYMTGICHMYLNDAYFAEQRFNEILQQYPNSRYVNEAKYHLGVIHAQSASDLKRSQGLNELFLLAEYVRDSTLSKDIRTAIAKLLFEATAPFLQQYYPAAPAKHKTTVLEALCYRLVTENRKLEAKAYYTSHLQAGNATTPLLTGLFKETVKVDRVHREVIRVALCLPLHLNEMDSSSRISPKSEAGLAYYEGFQEALNEYERDGTHKILLKVFDIQRDTLTAQIELPAIEAFAPDLLIGAIYAPQAQILADWAERKGVTQLVPMSSKHAIVEGKRHIFLAHPSFEVHGRAMAKHAASLGLTKLAVVSDETPGSDQMANAFLSECQALGIEAARMTIAPDFRNGASRQISAHVSTMNSQNMQGVYLPLSNEESVGLFLSLIDRSMPSIRVMAAPYWQDFTALDRETTERMRVLYSTAYSIQNDTAFYQAYRQQHVATYHLPPNEYHVQGYDLGKYALKVVDLYQSDIYPLSSFFRNYPAFSGAHLTYEFLNTQENQRVHIMEQRRGGEIIKVN